MTSPPLRPLQVAVWPAYTGANAYLDLFYAAAAKLGVHRAGSFVPDLEWLEGDGRDIDVLHIHWPEKLWRRGGRTRAAHALGVLRLGRFLRAVRRRGVRVIWTVHNAEPHDDSTWVDRAGCATLARFTDLAIVHSRSAAQALPHRIHGDVVIVPHGNYAGVFPDPADPDHVLGALGLEPGIPVVSCLGLLRPYKGLDVALEAISLLAGRVQLVIAGAPHRTLQLDELTRAVTRAGHTVLVPRLLTNQEFADIASASDAIVLPYERVTSSGALLAAWTLERGVIASDLQLFREMSAGEPDACRTFRGGDAASLAEAIEAYLALPAATRSSAAARMRDRYEWDGCVAPLRPLLDTWRSS